VKNLNQKPKEVITRAEVSLHQKPEYKEVKTRLLELQEELGRVEARHSEIQMILATNRRLGDDIESKAAALLAGEQIEDRKHRGLREELDTVRERIAILRKAIEMQKWVLNECGEKYSKEIVQAVRPKYVALVRRMTALVKELDETAIEERAFRELLMELF